MSRSAPASPHPRIYSEGTHVRHPDSQAVTSELKGSFASWRGQRLLDCAVPVRGPVGPPARAHCPSSFTVSGTPGRTRGCAEPPADRSESLKRTRSGRVREWPLLTSPVTTQLPGGPGSVICWASVPTQHSWALLLKKSGVDIGRQSVRSAPSTSRLMVWGYVSLRPWSAAMWHPRRLE